MSVNLTLETLASKQRNDSTVAGVTVKDALEMLEGLTSGSGIVLHFYGDPIAAGITGGRIYLNGDSLELLPFEDNLMYIGNKRNFSKVVNTNDNLEYISDLANSEHWTYWDNNQIYSTHFTTEFVFNLNIDPVGAFGDITLEPIEIAHNHWCFEVIANTATKNATVELFYFVDAILNPATGQISTPASGGGGFTDGDYGDIVVSGSGTALTIDVNAVTNSKLAPNAVDVTKIANSTITQAKLNATGATNGRVLTTDGTDFSWQDLPTPPSGGLDDGTYGDIVVSGGGTVLTIGTDAVTTSKIQDGAVVNGKLATNAVGTPELSGNAVTETKIANNAVSTSKLQNEAVTFAKMQSVNTGKILGRTSAGTGAVEELDIANYSNKLIPLTTTTADCENTASETTITEITIPANTLAVGDLIKLEWYFYRLQNSGGTINIILRFRQNGSSIYSRTLGVNTNASTFRITQLLYMYVVSISGDNVTLEAYLDGGSQGKLSFTPRLSSTSADEGAISNSLSVNTTFDRTIENKIQLQATWASANVNAWIRMRQAVAYIIRNN